MAKNVPFSSLESLRTGESRRRQHLGPDRSALLRVSRAGETKTCSVQQEWCWRFDRAWGRSPPNWRISRSLLESTEIARCPKEGSPRHTPSFAGGLDAARIGLSGSSVLFLFF